jgi:hypothetical protein
MSFSSDLSSCMSPLPAPTIDGVEEFLDWLHQVHTAWEASGGESEMLIAGLVAAGAVTGIDEAALAAAGAATVMAYLAVATGCMTSILASDVWDWITADTTATWLQSQLMAQAQSQGISQPEATA